LIGAIVSQSNASPARWAACNSSAARAPLENIEGGARLAEFLEWFPDVTREQVEQVLLHAEKSLAA